VDGEFINPEREAWTRIKPAKFEEEGRTRSTRSTLHTTNDRRM
jgi:hypothetical protein